MFNRKDVDNLMTRLDGLIAANDPETIARYVSDVASVTNSESIQVYLTQEERQAVRNSASSHAACITLAMLSAHVEQK